WNLSLPIQTPGSYGLFFEAPGHPDGSPEELTEIAITPRVFSPSSGFGGTNVTRISFSLPKESDVSVKVYNRAGRLVREITRNQTMQAGLNSIKWDGHI